MDAHPDSMYIRPCHVFFVRHGLRVGAIFISYLLLPVCVYLLWTDRTQVELEQSRKDNGRFDSGRI